MATTKSKKKQRTASVIAIEDIRGRVEQIRQDVEVAVGTLGKRAVGVLPREQQKVVDEVVDRVSKVGKELNSAVETWRSDLEKRFKAVAGSVDKRVNTLRKETESRSKKLAKNVEKDVRKYVNQAFKRMQLPVRTDLDSVKRRLTAIERRLAAMEKGSRRRAA
jgi:BMFP domain-containing protein YqiC